MAIPQVEQSVIERALNEFDSKLRITDEWARWGSNKAQAWALEHDGRRYPPKKIISLATGISVNEFSGGPETNDYLGARGFNVNRLRDLGLASTIGAILENYGPAKATQAFGGHHEIRDLFTQGRRILEAFVEVRSRPHIQVVASYGKGNWATIPWISLLDDRETRTTQSGTYVVYLFREDGQGCYVKLAQGVTQAEKELGSRAAEVLAERASDVRNHCASLTAHGFDLSGRSDLGTTNRLAKLYEASTIAAKYYPRDAIPDEQQLRADLDALLQCYEAYVTSRNVTGEPAQDTRRLSLIGTWRGVRQDYDNLRKAIEAEGGSASPWSFPIRNEAISRLSTPFFLYAYGGDRKVPVRFRVDAMQTSRGQNGIQTPWPDLTNPEWLGKTRSGDKQSDVFKTWFKFGDVTFIDPPRSIDDFELAVGLSTPENVLNQNTFGYVIEDENMPENPQPVKAIPEIQPPPFEIAWLEERTGLNRTFLEELVESVLGPSPQIMLAGPPGTSKTWLARQLALYLTRNRPDQVRFVQFHPGYSYESFIQGLSPVTQANGVSFVLKDGVVCQVVKDMQEQGCIGAEGNEFVVVVDEANRANLPRVLGELMFLFEYRDQPTRLQYSENFTLPRNLRFIATMNTADRSIRSIDVALRRRFDVFELKPDPEILARHYTNTGASSVPDLIDGFVALNAALESCLDRHHTIGHAFFMRDLMDARMLSQVWSRRVFPLIEEFFFDQPDLTKEFSLERFWPGVGHGV